MPIPDAGYVSAMGKRGKRKVKPHAIRLVVGGNVDKLLGTDDRSAKTQAIAKAAGIDRRTVNRLVSGEYAASLDTIGYIADALHVKPLELLVERETMLAGGEPPLQGVDVKQVTERVKSKTKR